MQRYLFSILLVFEYQMFSLLKVSFPFHFLASSTGRCLTASSLDVVHFTFFLYSLCLNYLVENKARNLDQNLFSHSELLVWSIPTGKSNRLYEQAKARLPGSYRVHPLSPGARHTGRTAEAIPLVGRCAYWGPRTRQCTFWVPGFFKLLLLLS